MGIPETAAKKAAEALDVIQRGLCKHCKKKPIAYPGALFCGAACSAQHEAHEEPPK